VPTSEACDLNDRRTVEPIAAPVIDLANPGEWCFLAKVDKKSR
jgi:hypothetical protein